MGATMGVRILMDTKFWIHLKEDVDYRQEFKSLVRKEDVEVLFSAGNFIDLLKYDEQDVLSKIIADIVDRYIPMQSYSGDSFESSTQPECLIPGGSARREFVRQTHVLDDDLALKYLFRTADWETPDHYIKLTEEMRDVYNEFGFDNSMGYVFKEYLEIEGDTAFLSEEKVDATRYIRGMLMLHRIEQMKKNENPDRNDFADMEICAHAIISNCDHLFIESKWINTGVIENVMSRLTIEGPTLHEDYDRFLLALMD